MGQGEAVIPTSTLATNQPEAKAALVAAGTDPSTARGSRFHVDGVTLPPIGVKRAHNPLFGDLEFSVQRLRDSRR
jgi:hypothetical protein